MALTGIAICNIGRLFCSGGGVQNQLALDKSLLLSLKQQSRSLERSNEGSKML